MRLQTIFMLLMLIGMVLPGVLARDQPVPERFDVGNDVKESVIDLSSGECVQRLQMEYPLVSKARLEEKCATIQTLAQKVNIRDEFPRIADAAKERLEGLNEEEKNKLRFLSQEKVEQYAKMNADDIKARLKQVVVNRISDPDMDFKKRMVKEEVKLRAKNRISELEDEESTLENGLVDNTREFNHYKQLEKECQGDDNVNCEEARQRAIEFAKKFLTKVGELELNMLERLQNRAEKSEDLTDDELQEIVADIDFKKAEIETALSDLEAAQTKEEIKEIGKTLFQFKNQLKNRFSLYEYKQYHARVNGIFEQARVLDNKLNRLLEYFADNDIAADDISALVDEYHVLIASAKDKFDNANSKLEEAWILNKESEPDVEQIQALTKESRTLLQSAHEDIKDASVILGKIFAQVRDYKKIIDKNEEEDFYEIEDESELDDSDDVMNEADDTGLDDSDDDQPENEISCVLDADCEEGLVCDNGECALESQGEGQGDQGNEMDTGDGTEDDLCGNAVCEEGEGPAECPTCEGEPCPGEPCFVGTCPEDCEVSA